MDKVDWLERTKLLVGDEQVERLAGKHVLVAGLGGVGAYAAEMICRAGVGELSIIDGDVIHPSNRNRQLLALKTTEGKSKAELMAARLKEINPKIKLNIYDEYLREGRTEELLSIKYDYVVDAIDTLAHKIFLIYHSLDKGLKVASSMGAGGKKDPTQIQISDISKSYNCKLAAVLRKRLHRLDVYTGVKVVFSSEKIAKDSVVIIEDDDNKKSTVGTISYMPAIFGCYLASIVINDLLKT